VSAAALAVVSFTLPGIRAWGRAVRALSAVSVGIFALSPLDLARSPSALHVVAGCAALVGLCAWPWAVTAHRTLHWGYTAGSAFAVVLLAATLIDRMDWPEGTTERRVTMLLLSGLATSAGLAWWNAGQVKASITELLSRPNISASSLTPGLLELDKAIRSAATGLAVRFAVGSLLIVGLVVLIGRTDQAMWNLDRDPPAALQPGDRVRFVEIGGPPPVERVETPTDPPPVEPVETPAAALEIVSVGAQALLQDHGRPGLAAMGVPGSGALDRFGLHQANRLVGNPSGTVAIEFAFGGAVRALADVVVCVSGERTSVALTHADGRTTPITHPTPVHLHSDDRLTISPGRGARTYLAVRGGFDVPVVLGSRASDVLSGIGPAPLEVGAGLAIAAPTGPSTVGEPEPWPRRLSAGVIDLPVMLGRPRWTLGLALTLQLRDEFLINVRHPALGRDADVVVGLEPGDERIERSRDATCGVGCAFVIPEPDRADATATDFGADQVAAFRVGNRKQPVRQVTGVLGGTRGEVPVVGAGDAQEADDADVEIVGEHRRLDRAPIADAGEQFHILGGQVESELFLNRADGCAVDGLRVIEANRHEGLLRSG